MGRKMLTYEQAQGMMKSARNGRRKLGNNTYLEIRKAGEQWAGSAYANGNKEAPHYAVRLHSTDVVTLHPDGSQTLNSGGWRTVTTKDRINAYSIASVWSERWMWKVAVQPRFLFTYYGGGQNPAYDFVDGMRVYPDGRVVGADPVADAIEHRENARA